MSRAEERLRNPSPGSCIEAALDFGIDLTLLIEQLRKTPEERVQDLQQAINALEAIRGKARDSITRERLSGGATIKERA